MGRLIRVAQVVGRMKGAGVETTMMNHYRHIDRSQVQFDFIAQDDSTDIPYNEIQSLGGRVFTVPSYKHLPQYLAACERIFRQTRPDIVHSGLNALSVFPLMAAKHAGVPIRVAHSHSTGSSAELTKTVLKDALRPFSRVYPTHYAACSEHAARWLFGNRLVDQHRVYIMRNAIEVERFCFDVHSRDVIRDELGIAPETVVIGQIGRLSKQKNQLFSLDVFAELLKKQPNAVLVFAGDDDGLDIRPRIHELGLDEHVKLLGVRHDVPSLYSAFDALLFPSTYEGLGMVAVEAQAADLPVVMSDQVPEEAVIVPDLVTRLPLTDSIDDWSGSVLRCLEEHKTDERENRKRIVTEAGYDISRSATELCDWYQRIAKVCEG